MNYLIVDNSTLQNIWVMGGPDAWDKLLDNGNIIIISDQIQEEARRGPHGPDLDDWIIRNSNTGLIERPEYRTADAIDLINDEFPNEIGDRADLKPPYNEINIDKRGGATTAILRCAIRREN